MGKRATDSEIAKLARQTATLIRMADEGKRDPEWVSGVIQAAIEHREDGRIDFVKNTEVTHLGTFEVDYSIPLSVAAEGIKTFNPEFELYDRIPKPMYYTDGAWKVELALTQYKFNEFRDALGPTYDDIRRLIHESGMVPVQYWELIALLQHKPYPLGLSDVERIVALGCGVPSAGRVGATPCVFECVPAAERFMHHEAFELRQEYVTHGRVKNQDTFLVRKVESEPPWGDTM